MFSETMKGCTRNFLALRDKKFSTKSCDIPIMHKVFDTRNFLKHWRDAHKIFRHCETENFQRNYVIPSLMHKKTITPNFLKIEGMPTIFWALCDPKFLTENVIPPVLHKNFRYHNFAKTLQGCSWNFSALWDQSFSREKYDTPLFSSEKTFRNEKFSQKQ